MANLFNAINGIDRLEELSQGNSYVHRLHPMAKLVVTFFYIVIVVSFPFKNISGLMPFIFYPALMAALSDTPYRPLLARLLVALPFSLMGGLGNLFFMRDTLFYIGKISISAGLVSFASIMLKTVLTVAAVLILIATTSFIDICYQLTVLKVPKILCLQFIMTYRYLSVLLNEAFTMYTSYALRAPLQKGIKMSHMGSFLGQLILRSFDRAERVYHAMKCRGFNGVYNSKIRGRLTINDWLFTISLLVLISFFRVFNFSIFIGNAFTNLL